jgi:hypothetical protein
MELLINPQSSYLLQADLDSLQAESKSWLEEIEFWQDELAFFFKLLHSKLSSTSYPAPDIAEFDKLLVRINTDNVDNLKVQVLQHERDLATVLQATSMSEQEKYRTTHRELHGKMVETHAVIRKFKREVYMFVYKYENK